ncbi:MAG TPA: FHA domain-containing protein [Actinomycetota bacterium]
MVFAQTVTPFVLAVFKYAFLALLYFFVFRAIRSVAIDVTGRRRPSVTQVMAEQRAPKPAKGGKPGKAPTSLVVRTENGKKAGSFNLREQLQIGRAEACHVRLDDRYSSQFHARLYPKDGGWYLEDLGSTNGTYLNRQRVQGTTEVHAGDNIRIGRTTLELRR